ncbi:MAG: hypothetical protein ABIO29_06050 [Sphingomicrobium sp.]
MRCALLILAIAVVAAAPAAAEPTISESIADAQRMLDDPRNEKLFSSVMSALSDALLDMPVGEIKAATEGRVATAEEKRLTVRDIARREDPAFEAKMRDGVAKSAPALRQSMKALSASLPALAKSAEALGRSIERLGANLPDPTYPKR